MVEDVGIRALAESLVTTLSEGGKTISTAESCTGGWIAKAITDIPGSSAAFAYGIVSYSNDAKKSLLGVKNPTLEDNGAVSEAVVTEMVTGALQLSGADIAVAVSGIAGPDGGSDDKPVGTTWFGWAVRGPAEVAADCESQCFDGNRNEVRVQAVAHALRGAISRMTP